MDLATRAWSRAASVGLAGVLLFLTGFALWTATTTLRTVKQVERSSSASRAFERARYAVAAEESFERKYRLEPGPESQSQFDAATRSLEGALAAAGHADGAAEAVIARTLEQHRVYLRATERMFAAVDAGRLKRVVAIDHAQTEPAFARIEHTVETEADAHTAEAASRLRALDSSQSHVLIATPIAFALGLLLLGGFLGILVAYRRRAESATKTELRRLEHAALTDNLTGLRNHRAFQEDVSRELKRRERHETPLSLAMIDLDGLKSVNDTQGHQAGDEHLKIVALYLRETARGSDAAYRLGGDEFAVVLANETAWGAFRFAQRLQEALSAGTATEPVKVTVGVAEAEGSMDKDTLSRHADLALIEAKRTGHASLIYSPGIEPDLHERDASAHQHHLKTLATALARAVDAKDAYTRSHCETVSELCSLIGGELGLDEERIAKLRLAGLLHDVGKIGITDAILQKPSKLTETEFEVMKTHSTLGHRIVSGTDLDEEADWILHHHERPDGRGYPHGLEGDEVPLESRIILVADAFEAITSDRVYRKGRPESEALVELERHTGSQFDPDCVAALKRALGHRDHERQQVAQLSSLLPDHPGRDERPAASRGVEVMRALDMVGGYHPSRGPSRGASPRS